MLATGAGVGGVQLRGLGEPELEPRLMDGAHVAFGLEPE